MSGPVDSVIFLGQPGQPVIVATGAVNGLAFDPLQTWAFWRAEGVGTVETPFRCADGKRATMVTVRTLPPKTAGVARLGLLARDALAQIAPALARLGAGARIGLAVCVTDRFTRRPRAAAIADLKELETDLRSWFEARPVKLAALLMIPRGAAGMGFGLLEAAAPLGAGQLDAVVLVGVDSYHDPDAVEELLATRRLFDGKNVDSMIPGEGAAALLLTTTGVARQVQLVVRGRIDAAAAAQEPATMLGTAPCDGGALSRVLRAITTRVVPERGPIEWLVGDLTNESYRARELQMSLPRALAPGGIDSGGVTFRQLGATPLRSDFLPLRFGDLGAATMPTAVVIALEAFARGAPRANGCLVFASSAGSDRGALFVSGPTR